MAFNSINFVLYLAVFIILYYAFPIKKRWIVGLCCSIVFYAMINLKALGILACSSYIDFYLALKIEKSPHPKRGRFLTLGIVINILLIFGFKYFNLFNSTALNLFNHIFDFNFQIVRYQILIPAGISFYCFKKMSYLIDVGRGACKAEKQFGFFLLYTSLFLEILSGPIDRGKDLLPQLKKPQPFETELFINGVILVLWGLFMKVCIADRLCIYTDAIFNNVMHHNGPSLLVAAYFYSFQIYCDFAGYTYMALGCGKMMGLELAPNFNQPYFAESISDFWRRWHMTLSFWFRDYLYIPLGGSRVNRVRRYFNLMTVFLICGLWHGDRWTFVVWGGIHGIYLIFALMIKNIRNRIDRLVPIHPNVKLTVRIIITFHLVSFGWIFFRCNSIADAWYFVTNITANWPNVFMDMSSMAYGAMGIMVLIAVEVLQYVKMINFAAFFNWSTPVRWSAIYILIFLIILTGISSDSAFIYYQF